MIFKDQYLELSSVIPQEANIYGLGEHIGSFRRARARVENHQGQRCIDTARLKPLWSTSFLYGGAKWQGARRCIFDFYFFTPDACFSCAAISRSDWIFGHASLPDLGSAPVPLGYHSLDTFCDMIEGYKKAKIPLDGIWMDIE
ncbi:hypothetical protein BC937DRAFT_92698 [Endogone sp. FLAS-F59071]|nr:hypothetical protein BC937DRAFT_92698 [Endogone sp. FLAS-F59071]|eukprot:RUS15244.1 hypothetical protein BC937DRAFT_92698 [Endogone sp. FLAS-F59071]